MQPEHRQLMLRANRLLGAGLLEANLVREEDVTKANESLMAIVDNDAPRQSTLLGILAYDLKVIREEDILQFCVDEEGLGLIDLRGYDVHDDVKKTIEVATCWATWSVPFDHDEDFYFVATAYYLSPAVRSFWEKQFAGPILWFGTTIEVIADYLEKLTIERTAPAPLPPPLPSGTRSPFGAPSSTRSSMGRTGTPQPFGKNGTPTPFGKSDTGSQFPKPITTPPFVKPTTPSIFPRPDTRSPFPPKTPAKQ
ncbi:MAG: hypothetical protein JWM32_1955 [Verrucomicrobia bacterium]|nr:hypothetical protein [Verrucomicrobiota bacterium]